MLEREFYESELQLIHELENEKIFSLRAIIKGIKLSAMLRASRGIH